MLVSRNTGPGHVASIRNAVSNPNYVPDSLGQEEAGYAQVIPTPSGTGEGMYETISNAPTLPRPRPMPPGGKVEDGETVYQVILDDAVRSEEPKDGQGKVFVTDAAYISERNMASLDRRRPPSVVDMVENTTYNADMASEDRQTPPSTVDMVENTTYNTDTSSVDRRRPSSSIDMVENTTYNAG